MTHGSWCSSTVKYDICDLQQRINKVCQEWDLNTRSLKRIKTWVWSLRPLEHLVFVWKWKIFILYVFISHINFLYCFAHFECNTNIFHISYAAWCRMFPLYYRLILLIWFSSPLFIYSIKLFLSDDFHIFVYMNVDIIMQIQACMNFLNEACMLMLFGGKIWPMRPPTKTQQSLSRVGFEPTLFHKNQNLSLAP